MQGLALRKVSKANCRFYELQYAILATSIKNGTKS